MSVPAFLLSIGPRSRTVLALSLLQSPVVKDSSESVTMPYAWTGPSALLRNFSICVPEPMAQAGMAPGRWPSKARPFRTQNKKGAVTFLSPA